MKIGISSTYCGLCNGTCLPQKYATFAVDNKLAELFSELIDGNDVIPVVIPTIRS